jgi:hypothetical protein
MAEGLKRVLSLNSPAVLHSPTRWAPASGGTRLAGR